MIRSGGFCFVSIDDSLSVMNSAARCKAFYEKVSVSVPVPVEAFSFNDRRLAFNVRREAPESECQCRRDSLQWRMIRLRSKRRLALPPWDRASRDGLAYIVGKARHITYNQEGKAGRLTYDRDDPADGECPSPLTLTLALATP